LFKGVNLTIVHDLYERKLKTKFKLLYSQNLNYEKMKRTHLKMKIRNGFIAVPLLIVAVLLSSCKDDVTTKSIYDPSL